MVLAEKLVCWSSSAKISFLKSMCQLCLRIMLQTLKSMANRLLIGSVLMRFKLSGLWNYIIGDFQDGSTIHSIAIGLYWQFCFNATRIDCNCILQYAFEVVLQLPCSCNAHSEICCTIFLLYFYLHPRELCIGLSFVYVGVLLAGLLRRYAWAWIFMTFWQGLGLDIGKID